MNTYSVSRDLSSVIELLNRQEDCRLYKEGETLKDLRKSRATIRAMDTESINDTWIDLIKEA